MYDFIIGCAQTSRKTYKYRISKNWELERSLFGSDTINSER